RGCKATFEKKPDEGIRLRSRFGRFNQPILAMEFAVRHEDLGLLFREAEVLLNRFTRVRYALLVRSDTRRRFFNLRIILVERLEEQPMAQFQNEEEQEALF